MLSFEGNILDTSSGTYTLPRNILEAIEIDGGIYVIYNSMEFKEDRADANLVRINESGENIWEADNPTGDVTDAYIGFDRIIKQGKGKIVAFNFSCFKCTINSETGKIINAKFTK